MTKGKKSIILDKGELARFENLKLKQQNFQMQMQMEQNKLVKDIEEKYEIDMVNENWDINLKTKTITKVVKNDSKTKRNDIKKT